MAKKSSTNPVTETVLERVCDKVTKRNIEKAFSKQKGYIDTRFNEQNKYIDARFDEQNEYIDARFDEQKEYIDARFAKQDKKREVEREQDRNYFEVMIKNTVKSAMDEYREESRAQHAQLLGVVADIAGQLEKQNQERTIYAARVTENTQRIESLETKVFGTAKTQ
jgi:hypothetical protein